MIDLSLNNGIYEIALHAPPSNEIGSEMLRTLTNCIDTIDSNQSSVLIIYSQLPGRFCAGANLRELHDRLVDTKAQPSFDELAQFIADIHAVFNRIDQLPVVTIAAINGICFGGGFELALTCDLLIAEKKARFCFPELRLGIIPGFGGIPRLQRECGNAVVRDMLFTGRSLNAKRLHQLGLISQLVASGYSLVAARNTAEQIKKYSPEVIRAAKQFIKRIPANELQEEQTRFMALAQQPQLRTALSHFVSDESLLPYQI